jgi:hypothetical protein
MEAQVLDTQPEATHDAEVLRLKRMVEAADVEGARRYVKELEERWPDSPRVKYWASVLAPPVARSTGESTGRRLDDEYAWIKAHADEYRGQWVAVHGSTLVGASADLTEVLAQVKAHPEYKRPLLQKIPA